MVDLEKLRQAVAVAQAGSYTAAAREIRISQSALTRSINMLEQFYGLRLFERGRSGAKLTLAGSQFIAVAEEILRDARNAHDRLAQLPTANVTIVKFGIGPMSATSILPRLLPLLCDQTTRYRIRIAGNSLLRLMLRQGEIDFFIGGIRKGDESHALANEFSVQPLATAAMRLLVRPGHPLLAPSSTPSDVAMFPTAGGSFVRETFGLATLASFGLQEPSLEVDDYPLLMNFILESDHILIGNKILSHTPLGSQLIPLKIAINIADASALALVSAKGSNLTGPIYDIIKIINHLFLSKEVDRQ